MSEHNVDHSMLYQKHIPIHTRSVKGKFRNFKTAVLIVAFAVYFLLPWLPWQRVSAANQAVMFDLVTKRFFIFDLVSYPQDIFWMSMLLFLAAALLWLVYLMYSTLVHYTGAVPAEFYSRRKRPAYADYQARVNRFFPGPRRPPAALSVAEES